MDKSPNKKSYKQNPPAVRTGRHYYPFGMAMKGHGTPILSENQYQYNGKELNSDFGLDLYDYGARWYDASVGRWHGVDPLAEAFSVHSPYNYGVNNPIMMVDPDGRASQCAMCGGNVSGYKSGAQQSAEAEKRSEQHRKQNETHSTVTDENGNQHNIKNSDIAGSIDPNSIESIDPYGYKVLNSDGSVYKNVVQGHNINFKNGATLSNYTPTPKELSDAFNQSFVDSYMTELFTMLANERKNTSRTKTDFVKEIKEFTQNYPFDLYLKDSKGAYKLGIRKISFLYVEANTDVINERLKVGIGPEFGFMETGMTINPGVLNDKGEISPIKIDPNTRTYSPNLFNGGTYPSDFISINLWFEILPSD
jgi:RHS repeat-associated protein